jgi:hypothetical protein
LLFISAFLTDNSQTQPTQPRPAKASNLDLEDLTGTVVGWKQPPFRAKLRNLLFDDANFENGHSTSVNVGGIDKPLNVYAETRINNHKFKNYLETIGKFMKDLGFKVTIICGSAERSQILESLLMNNHPRTNKINMGKYLLSFPTAVFRGIMSAGNKENKGFFSSCRITVRQTFKSRNKKNPEPA